MAAPVGKTDIIQHHPINQDTQNHRKRGGVITELPLAYPRSPLLLLLQPSISLVYALTTEKNSQSLLKSVLHCHQFIKLYLFFTVHSIFVPWIYVSRNQTWGNYSWGSGMVASSSISPPPHLGRVIRNLVRLLHAVLHGLEALVYSNYPRKAAASLCLVIIFWQIAIGIPWFLRSKAVSMQPHISADTDVDNGNCFIYRGHAIALQYIQENHLANSLAKKNDFWRIKATNFVWHSYKTR